MTVSFIFIMDILGMNILAITTATGGGVIRDLLIGRTPPVMFSNPLYVFIAILTANVVFGMLYFHRKYIINGIYHEFRNRMQYINKQIGRNI